MKKNTLFVVAKAEFVNVAELAHPVAVTVYAVPATAPVIKPPAPTVGPAGLKV